MVCVSRRAQHPIPRHHALVDDGHQRTEGIILPISPVARRPLIVLRVDKAATAIGIVDVIRRRQHPVVFAKKWTKKWAPWPITALTSSNKVVVFRVVLANTSLFTRMTFSYHQWLLCGKTWKLRWSFLALGKATSPMCKPCFHNTQDTQS